MTRSKVSEQDLLEEARLKCQVQKIQDISLATLERNGEISVIPKE